MRAAWLVALLIAWPARAESPFALGGFAHDKHAKLSGEKACAACHAGPPATSPPAKATCVRCHDGTRAFSTVDTACRRCHKPPKQVLPLPPLGAPATFSHLGAAHELACNSCHTLGADRRALPTGARHLPCANAGCHADEFRAASPRTCSVCHVGTEPWRPLASDAARRVVTEFGVVFPHAKHQVAECARCHTGITGGPAMRVGPGHDACSTCHQDLSSCTKCHTQGLLASRDERRRTEPWSVARRFVHATHASPCASCHEDVARAADLASIRPPPKRTCAPCHGGGKAFKMTGHGCARCHGES